MNKAKSTPAPMNDFEAQLERSFSTDNWVENTDVAEREKAVTVARLSKSERTNR
jgi:hypothetical protein